MTSTATFLSVSDVRGDMQFLARALELAVRRDVGAQAIFITGNFVGQVLTPEERAEYEAARTQLRKELDHRPDYYKELHIHDVAMLGHHMTQNPANYRRQAENAALRQLRVLVGLRDTTGRFLEVGRAGMRARRPYADAEKLFKRCPIPVYVMGDTVFAEDVLDKQRWLHYAWFSFSGYSVRGLSSLDGDDSTGVPELAMGVRRAGKPVALDQYSLASGDLIFAHALNPFLHEALAAVPGKLCVIVGEGNVDVASYPNTIVSSQKAQAAYLYRSEGTNVSRRTFKWTGSGFGDPSVDDVAAERVLGGRDTATRRRELDEQAKLASFGQDLIKFTDFMRAENPALADEIEQSRSRVEAIMSYVRDLEATRTRLLDVISTQRAGLERLARSLEPTIGAERMQQVIAALNLPPAVQTDVGAIDGAYAEVARIIAEALTPAPAKPQQ
jgi:hypothetical protein